MAIEIERKFLPKNDKWRRHVTKSTSLVQGYLSRKPFVVRVRIENEASAELCIKGKTVGISRPEFEYEIPISDARSMLEQCEEHPLSKIRHYVRHKGHTFEIDEFTGALAGLIVIEVELTSEHETVDLPDWVGKEVTSDSRYANARLVKDGIPA